METVPVATNLLGRHATWYGSRGSCGGTIVAVTFSRDGFLFLVSTTDEGLVTKRAEGVSVS